MPKQRWAWFKESTTLSPARGFWEAFWREQRKSIFDTLRGHRWFSSGTVLLPRGHLAVSRDRWVVQTEGMLLMSNDREQGSCKHSTTHRNCPQQGIMQPQLSMVLRLGNLWSISHNWPCDIICYNILWTQTCVHGWVLQNPSLFLFFPHNLALMQVYSRR